MISDPNRGLMALAAAATDKLKARGAAIPINGRFKFLVDENNYYN